MEVPLKNKNLVLYGWRRGVVHVKVVYIFFDKVMVVYQDMSQT